MALRNKPIWALCFGWVTLSLGLLILQLVNFDPENAQRSFSIIIWLPALLIGLTSTLISFFYREGPWRSAGIGLLALFAITFAVQFVIKISFAELYEAPKPSASLDSE